MSELNPTSQQPLFFVTPGNNTVTAFQEQNHYSQAVRMGDRVEMSGQGGWDEDISFPDDLEQEIVKAFDNVEMILAEAGATWADVISVDSYHVPTEDDEIGGVHTRVMAEQMRARMGERRPIWTEIGVAALGAVGMRVEIKVTAVIGRA